MIHHPIAKFLFLAVLVVTPAIPMSAAEAPLHACDRLAAHPAYAVSPGIGVTWENLDTVRAIPACEAAVRAFPKIARFQYQLARALQRAKRFAPSLALYRDLAAQGHAAAQSNLANMHRTGQGVPKDMTKAMIWYRKRAEAGEAWAQYTVARALESGEGLARNLGEAAVWYGKATDAGHADAGIRRDRLYALGVGPPAAIKAAAARFHNAAADGDVHAQILIGTMYLKGGGVARNRGEAAKWLIRAAEQGRKLLPEAKSKKIETIAGAAHWIGLMYRHGKGVPQDQGVAQKWEDLANIQ